MKQYSIVVVRVAPDIPIAQVEAVKDEPFAVMYNDDEGAIYVFCEEPYFAYSHSVDHDRLKEVSPGVEMYRIRVKRRPVLPWRP